MATDRNAKCKDRIGAEYAETMKTLRRIIENHYKPEHEQDPDVTPFYEYGLSFDYVAPGTFRDQRVGYWRYQLSWGGPSDEFRFYANAGNVHRIEYWFMDWFDGAKRTISPSGRDGQWLIQHIWSEFDDLGMVDSSYASSVED